MLISIVGAILISAVINSVAILMISALFNMLLWGVKQYMKKGKYFWMLLMGDSNKPCLIQIAGLLVGFLIFSFGLAIPGGAFTNEYLSCSHSKNILGSVNFSIILAFFIISVIYLIYCLLYTKLMINKCRNKYRSNFYSHMIKFIFSSVIGMIGVFSIALELIDGSIFNLLSADKIIRKAASLNLNGSLMAVFLIPSVAFSALIIITYYYEKILVKKFNEQDELDKHNNLEMKYFNNILGKS